MALKINSASGSITLTAEDGSGNADVTIPRAGIVSDLSDLSITATATELNYVDGVTSNIQTQLDAKGTVSTLADLSVTASAAELNLLDGVTATTTELNYVDGVTSNIQTQLNAKGTVSTLADLSVTASAAELNLLDGVTATTTELNYVDGVTSAIQTQIDGKLSTSLKGAASGLAELDSSGLVPTSQLPSYVDDVLEYTNASSFPASGTTGKIYVALDTNDIYRWSGSAYVKVSDAVSTSDQATALATARTIALTGDVTGSTSFDGSANVSITATIADDSHNHVISNVDGLQTALDAKLATTGGNVSGNVTFADSAELRLGTSSDLKIFHNGSNSYISDGGTGNLYVQTNRMDITNPASSETMASFVQNGAVTLYHNNVARLTTNSTGIDVSGGITADSVLSLEASSGYANIEIGGPSGGFIDIKTPFSDDFDARIIYDGSVFDLGTQTAHPTRLKQNNAVKLSTTSTGVDVTGTLTTDGVTVDGTLDIEEVFEKVNTFSGTSGTIAFNALNYGVAYFTANQTANRTINFRGDASTTLNSALAIGQSVTTTTLMTQGSTAYYLNAYQVDGTAVTPKWSGGSAPSAGNASGVDVYTFTIIKTANATFTVLASVTQYA